MSDLRLSVARELRDIRQLCRHLRVEAWHHYADKSGIPGGDPLVMIGPVATMAIWDEQIEAAEHRYFAAEARREGSGDWQEIYDLDSDPAPPLLILAGWEDIIREERDDPTGLAATIDRAADYIAGSVDWMLDAPGGVPNFLPVDALHNDLLTLRLRLEAVLHDGVRHDSSAAACFKDDADNETGKCGGRLVRRTLERRVCEHVKLAEQFTDEAPVEQVLGVILRWFPHIAAEHKGCEQGGRDDVYRCQKCRGFYTESEYWLAVREHYERQAG